MHSVIIAALMIQINTNTQIVASVIVYYIWNIVRCPLLANMNVLAGSSL